MALPFRPRIEPQPDPAFGRDDEDPESRRLRKDAKLLAEARRPLDPWERYRALVDALEEGIDLAEQADRKVRFAMVVMASLNIGVFAVTARPELLGLEVVTLRGWLGAYLLAYGVVAVFFFVQAIDALRPRTPLAPGARRPFAEASSLRSLDRVVGQELADYARSWREVRFDELHNELAAQSHRVAQVNHEKYAALGRLYGGLRVLAVLFGGLVLLAGLSPIVASLGQR